MVEVNIEAGLRQLSSCLKEIRSLLAWDDLVKAETKPGTPPSFQIDHHTAQDLLIQSGTFIKTAMDIHDVLNHNRKAAPSEQARERWKKRLARLEAGFRKLNLSERYIKT